MGNKKKRKVKKEKKPPEYRNKEERKAEVKHILEQLNEFHLNVTYDPVRKLFEKFKEYIREGERLIVNIPFPEINRRIKGVLAINKKEDVTIALMKEKF
jgi:ribosomal protein S4